MHQRLKAVFRDGVLVPAEELHLQPGAEVGLTVEGPIKSAPEVTDPVERKRIIEEVIRRMQSNPIPIGSPRLDRDALHARR
jgi:hypothetical protein